ncbi:MAG TPA: peptide ABC transporter substrate-binding protein, partial [Enterococcus sp.]|nr:peptide ABC transporter substrate-binding protein [Enterococcus sp.]
TQPAERWQALLDAENILIEDMGTIPVYQRAEAHLRAEKVKNIVSHGAGASHDYKWAYIEE